MSRPSGQPGMSSKDGASGDSSWITSLPRGSGKLQDYLTKTQSSKKSYSPEVRVPRRTLGISGSVSSQREKFQAISSSTEGGRKKAPSFEKELSDITCNHGDRLTLECRIAGSPSPKVTWYKDGEQIKYHKDYRISQTGHIAKLSIVSAAETDIGQFSCCATNSEGEATSVGYLTVEGGNSNSDEDRSHRSRSSISSRSRYQEQEDVKSRYDGARYAGSLSTGRLRNDSGGSSSGRIARSELVIPPAKRYAPKEDDLNVSDPNLPSIKTVDNQELRVNKQVELVINTKGKVVVPLSTRMTTNTVITSLEMKQDSNNNTGQTKNERSEVMIFPEVGETDVDSCESRKIELVTPSYESKDEVKVSRRVESVVSSRRSNGEGADGRETTTSHITLSSMRARNGVQEQTHFTTRLDGGDDDSRNVKVYSTNSSRDYGSRLQRSTADSDELDRALDSVASDLRGHHEKSEKQSNPSEDKTCSSSLKVAMNDDSKFGGPTKGRRNRFLETEKAGSRKDDLSSPKRFDPLIKLRDADVKSRSQKFEVNLKKTSDRGATDDATKPKNDLKGARFMLKKTGSPRPSELKSDGVASWQRKRFEMDSAAKDNQSASLSHPRFTAKSKGLSALRGEVSQQPSESHREKSRTTLVSRRTEETERYAGDGDDKMKTFEKKEVREVKEVEETHREDNSSSNEEEPPAIPQSTFPGQHDDSAAAAAAAEESDEDDSENLTHRDAIDHEQESYAQEAPVTTTNNEPAVDDSQQEDTKTSLRKARLARMAEILAKADESDTLWDIPVTKTKESRGQKTEDEDQEEPRERKKQEERKQEDDERIQELERRRQERKKLLEEERKKEEEEKQRKEEDKKREKEEQKKLEEEELIKLAEQRREERRKKREEERRLQEEEEQRTCEEEERREEVRRKELERRKEEQRLEEEQRKEQERIEEERRLEEERLEEEGRQEEERIKEEARREEERKKEEKRKQEEARREEERKKEEKRKEEEARKEEERKKEEKRKEEEGRREEERKKEEKRKEEEARKEEERKKEEKRKEEEGRREEERKKEEKRKEEELEEIRKKEEEEERKKEEEKQREEQEEAEKSTIENISDLMFTADPNLTNGVNSDMSERSRRYTRESKPSFIIKPRRQFVDEGQVAKFKASFDGEPQPTVKWAYKNSPISDSTKYKIYEKNDFHFLEVNDVQEEDKGTYSITISNRLGSETMSAELEVFVKSKLTRSKKTAQPPKFEKELTDTVVKDGDRVTLECTVIGTPEPTVTWFFNNKLLKTSNDITQTYNGRRAKLTFVEVFPDDKGVYECVATNTGGEVKSACTLTVEGQSSGTGSVKNGEEKPEAPQDTAPVFSKTLENITVQDGAMVSLECNVTANPPPRVLWYKSGVQVKANEDFIMTYDGNLSRLLIQEVYPEDEGDYSCVAENPAGDARTKCKLIVKVPEQGKEELPPTPKSAPPPKTAPKPAGKKTSDTTPVAGIPPKVITKLKDMSVADGERVELIVEVDGTEPIDVVWLHGEKEIKKTSAVYDLLVEGTTHSLVIPEVYPEDAGLYVCEVYNEFGDAETNMTLAILDREVDNNDRRHGHSKNGAEVLEDGEDNEFYPPEFIRKPRSVNVEEGNSARFQCQIDAHPPPTVCWEKDGKILENGGRFRISEDGEMFTFEIPHTLATDAGRYVVIATNSLGTEKYSVSLMVKEIESTEVTDFRGVLKSSRPKSYGNTDVEVDQVDFRKVLQTANTPQSTRARTGTIEADYKVQPDAEQIDFRNVLTRHVKTKERPIVKKELRDTQAKEGEPVKLECIIIGTPLPEIRWYHGKKEVKESKYFKMSYERGYALLYMAEVYKEDEGEYLCMAVNTAGTVHSSCDLKMIERGEDGPRERRPVDPSAMEPPLIEDLQPDNLHILRGTTAQLKAKFAGEPRPNVVWTHGKNPVSTGGRLKIDVVRDTTTLTIQDAQPDDSGIYTLSVDNELGCDTCSSSLTVEDKPNPPAGQPAASNITGTSLTLSWYGPSFDGGSPITDYRVEIMKVGEVDWKTLTSNCKYTSFQVRNLEKNTEYLFRVSAANKHGFSDPGKISEVIVTIDRRRSSTKLAIPTDNKLRDLTPSPLSPLSAESFRALRDELAFEPREVTISDRVFKDQYVLSDEIGRGKFGNVCLCIEKSSGREMAVKFIRIKATERDQAQQEVNIMNQLHHPKLLMLYDAFQTPREVILVMELIAGGELFERIVDDDYILTERECVHFMRQIIDSVGFMHERNILHLDLKPENILCVTRNSNEIKIIDFGLARKFDPKKNFRVMFGTPEFVAPEVINYDQISYATDMWSVGVICYILISGISPFLGDSDADTLVNVTAAQFDFEDKSFDPVTEDARSFIEGLLTKNMRRRLTATKALAHPWLAQDFKFMKAKRLSTEKHKRFLARRRWQKTGNAIRALGRMTNMQKAFKLSNSSFSDSSVSGSIADTSTLESVIDNEDCITESGDAEDTTSKTEENGNGKLHERDE